MIQTTRIIAVGALLLWSMTVAAQELVHFPSFDDNGPGRSSTVLSGYLSRPTGEGQHPAVIFLHGCGGLLMGSMIEPGESDWAGELTRRGYAVLMVDSFAPRDRRQMCDPRTSDFRLYRNRARDAYGALLFLQTQRAPNAASRHDHGDPVRWPTGLTTFRTGQTGSYTVNRNCTGFMTINLSAGVGVTTIAFVISNGGRHTSGDGRRCHDKAVVVDQHGASA
jgi:hypothetical protein